jgi:tetratricopeptide (TPR) repeat protein
MHISLLPTSTPPETGPHQALLENNLAWLREELAGLRLPEQKAAIRHEIGVLEQLAGRDSVAVRDLLASVNSRARFKEPLERLIVLIERHRSFKNLPTLLEHLRRTADSAEEVARAELLSAWFAIMHSKDDTRASACVLASLEAVPEDAGALLTLELLARRLGDTPQLRRVLELRSGLATDPVWAGLLALDLADSYAATGEYERANSLLDPTIANETEISFEALRRRICWGRAQARPEWTIDALRLRATRIAEALHATTPELVQRVPASARQAAEAVDNWLEVARLERELGRDAAASDALERAALLAPEDPIVVYGLLAQAEQAGRHEHVAAIVDAELGRNPSSREAAALLLRLAESRMAANELSLALDALTRAQALDPKCWVARGLSLDLLRGTRDAVGYAEALEAVTQVVDGAATRSRYWLLAADVWARQVNHSDRATRALAAAEGSGAAADLVRRVERALAHAAGDQKWYAAAVQRLSETELSSQERSGLWLESWRSAFLASDQKEAERLLACLESASEGRWIARLARAYAAPASSGAADADSLLSLAELEPDASRASALRWVAALRFAHAGAAVQATECLAAEHARTPQSAAVAGALYSWLAREPESNPRLGAVLRSTASALSEDAFAASLYLEAGIRSWKAGDLSQAGLDFECAERRGAGSANVLGTWIGRGGTTAAELSACEPAERLLNAIEGAARGPVPELARLSELDAALQGIGDTAQSALVSAGRLLSLLVARGLGVRADPGALERFAAQNGDCARLADAWRYLECISHGESSAKLLEESARAWSSTSGGLAAALEWLAASQRLGHRRREGEARRRVSTLTSGPIAEQCASSAALVLHLTQPGPVVFLEGETAQLRLVNLETSPPGCDPRRRARALADVGSLLGEETEPMLCLLTGYNQLAFGDDAAAIHSFRRYTDAFPDDPSGWEGLLSAARHADDPVLLAEAAASLGNTSRDPAHAARLFEEAADVFFDPLNDAAAGQAALARAVELDIRRRSSFDRLFALVENSADTPRLLELIERRLGVVTDPGELLELEWERARALRRQDDIAGSLAALDRVTTIDPRHLGALALYGEIYVTTRRYAEAAACLAQLAARDDASAAERLTSGLAAVDLMENQLGATSQALQVLLSLHRAGLSQLSLRERLARAAAKSQAWDDAVIVLEQLMFERLTSEERAEAARLALAIHRDRRHDSRAAGPAARALLRILPEDAEALDLTLTGVFEPELTAELLAMGRAALVQRLSQNPFELDTIQRLARIAAQTGELQLRQTLLGALFALGQGQSESRVELTALDQRIHVTPAVAASDDLLAAFADPGDQGAVLPVLGLLAPHLGGISGPTLSTFQVGKRERVAASAGLPLRHEIAGWVGAFGLGDFELYVSPVAGERVTILSGEPLAVVVGSRVTAPLGPFQRQELARAAYAQRRGLGALLHLDETDVVALVVAACQVGGVVLETEPYARQRDFERQLRRGLPRRAQKLLPQLARAFRDTPTDIPAQVRSALSSLDRVGAIAVGDVSMVLPDFPMPNPAPGSAPAREDQRLRRLLQFVLSAEFPVLRQRFGVRDR